MKTCFGVNREEINTGSELGTVEERGQRLLLDKCDWRFLVTY